MTSKLTTEFSTECTWMNSGQYSPKKIAIKSYQKLEFLSKGMAMVVPQILMSEHECLRVKSFIVKIVTFCWRACLWWRGKFQCFAKNQEVYVTHAYVVPSAPNFICLTKVLAWGHLYANIQLHTWCPLRATGHDKFYIMMSSSYGSWPDPHQMLSGKP